MQPSRLAAVLVFGSHNNGGMVSGSHTHLIKPSLALFSPMDTTTSFYTPLKRLPDKPITFHKPQEIKYPKPTSQTPEVLKPLNEIAIQLSKTELLNKQNDLFSGSIPKKSVYYKPPSSSNVDNQFGIKTFLPPPVPRSFPLMKAPINSTTDNNETETTVPTGEWENPVMIQALSRQVNKSDLLKRVLMLMVLLMVLALALSHTSGIVSSSLSVMAIVNGLLLMINVYSFFCAQDQCLDLPLSNKQRVMLGLDPLDDDIDRVIEKYKYGKLR